MSNFLRDPLAFEKAIQKGFLHSRSNALDNVVEHIKEYAPVWDEDSLEALRRRFSAWLMDEDEEVDFRFGQANVIAFKAELVAEEGRVKGRLAMHDPPGIVYNVWNRARASNNAILRGEEAVEPVISVDVSARQGGLKQGANLVKNVAQPGVGVAQTATHSVGIGTVIAGGSLVAAAASPLGAGLLVGGAVLALVSSGLAVTSAVSTNFHLNGLHEIYNRRRDRFLTCDDPFHAIIADQVLPYIIFQKTKKLGRKEFAAIPVIGGYQGLRGLVRKVQKWQDGTLGTRRNNVAMWLAAHLVGTRCHLPQVIVKELFASIRKAGKPDLHLAVHDGKDGTEEMQALRGGEYDEVWPLLARKLKST